MALKKFKPTTPSRRHMTMPSFAEITKGKRPEKALTMRIKKNAGRNNLGRLTTRHRGGGSRTLYRIVDFKQVDKLNIPGVVKAIEYDPGRSAYIMLVVYKDGDKRYHLAPEDVKVGDSILTSEKAKIKSGNRMMLKYIPVGYSVHNVEMYVGKGGQLGRSAGANIKLVSLEGPYAQIQMPSGEVRMVDKECYGSIGIVGNIEHNNVKLGKAGRKRHMGWRPTVRGVVMNPVDHPHGGGEGRSPVGLKHPKTPWGMPALGFKTRRRHYTDKMIVKDRRRK